MAYKKKEKDDGKKKKAASRKSPKPPKTGLKSTRAKARKTANPTQARRTRGGK